MVDLRLLGVTMRQVPVSEVVARLFPWTLAGFAVMVASGALLFSANPLSYYDNLFFRIKLVALGLAGLNAFVFHRTVLRGAAAWDMDGVPPRRARLAGALSLALWAALITAGRMIYYDQYWFAPS